MGQRANLILVEKGKYQLFYSHWCANTLPRDLFWGPDHAQAFIRIQRPVGDSGWLDDVWAEGGAILDIDRKCLLLYGGEDILYDVPLAEPTSRSWCRSGPVGPYAGHTRGSPTSPMLSATREIAS